MRKVATTIAVGLGLCAPGSCPAHAQQGPEPKVIYGDDGRLDLYQVKNAQALKLADSTVALFAAGDVTIGASGRADLATENYGARMGLCKEEPFYQQPMGAFCSGSLVGPDLLMTAGHCVPSEDECAGTKFVFGFAIKKEGRMPTSVPAGDVYGCKKIVGRDQVDTGADWALVQLDRPVKGHAPLALSRAVTIEKGAPLFVIGHPAGLPTKVAGGATVRDASAEGYFVANLDTYGGNSGSAVFNAKTGLVEGILVRGEVDYVGRGDGCRISNKCPNEGCRGEDVTKILVVAPKIITAGHQARADSLGPTISALLSVIEGEALSPARNR